MLFREGEAYAPGVAKKDFSFPRETQSTYQLQEQVRKIAEQSNADIEEVYLQLKKLFLLRKYYLKAPTREIQSKIIEIRVDVKYLMILKGFEFLVCLSIFLSKR